MNFYESWLPAKASGLGCSMSPCRVNECFSAFVDSTSLSWNDPRHICDSNIVSSITAWITTVCFHLYVTSFSLQSTHIIDFYFMKHKWNSLHSVRVQIRIGMWAIGICHGGRVLPSPLEGAFTNINPSAGRVFEITRSTLRFIWPIGALR